MTEPRPNLVPAESIEKADLLVTPSMGMGRYLPQLAAELYHEEAFGPFEASEDDFTAIPAAIEKVETAFVEAHPDAAQVGVGIYLLKSLGGGDG